MFLVARVIDQSEQFFLFSREREKQREREREREEMVVAVVSSL